MIDLVWPLRGSGVLGGAGVVLFLLVILATVPVGWLVLRARGGAAAAGPVWLLLGFEVLACAYALFTPPWQTPDEPQHMLHIELARQVGVFVNEQAGLARPTTEQGRAFRRSTDEILRSMRATDTEHWLKTPKPINELDVLPFASELSHPPAYYALAATVTRPVAGAPILARLAAVRALGVALAAWTVWACGAVGRLVWHRRATRAEIPMALAVAIPGFCALAGSASNDRLAELVAALLVALLVDGVLERTRLSRPLPWAVGIVVLCVLGVLTKRTLLPVFLLVPVAVAIRLRHHLRLLLAAAVAVTAAAALVVLATWSPRLALWEREPSPAATARCRGAHAGTWTICLAPYANVKQQLPLVRAHGLAGKDLELSFWARSRAAPSNLQAALRSESGDIINTTTPVPAGWTLVSLRVRAPTRVGEMSLTLDDRGSSSVDVDEVVLRSTEGNAGNTIVNGSAELATAGVPTFLPTAVQRGGNSALDGLARILREPHVVIASRDLIGAKVDGAFGMYWGTAGWQRPSPLLPLGVRIALACLVALGVAGAVFALVRRRFPAGALLLLAAGIVALATVARDLPPDAAEQLFGRYLYPGLAAQTAVLAAGFGALWRWGAGSIRNAARLSIVVMHAVFVGTVFVPFLLK